MKYGYPVIVGIAALTLASCAGSPQKDIFTIRSGYDAAFLAPAVHYAALPRCPTADNICSDAKVIVTLQKADAAAKATLDAAEDTIRNHPTLDATAAIAAATNAISAAEKIIIVYSIK